jgi:peptide-methionine (S)-S-oxide reductase
VVDVESGYAGSEHTPATYEAVCTGETGLAEVVHILFDPTILAYEDLLKIFFVLHDPTTLNRQGNDIGTQYRSAIYTHSDAQLSAAQAMKTFVENAIEQTIVTEIEPFIAEQYTRAEDYHQEYFEHNPENSYCQIVIPYKLSKLRANFVGHLK